MRIEPLDSHTDHVSGPLQFRYTDQMWYNISYYDRNYRYAFGSLEATTACNQLGYNGGKDSSQKMQT